MGRLNLDFFGVFLLGCLGLTGSVWMPPAAGAAVLPVLFGGLLWASVVVRFCRAMRLPDRRCQESWVGIAARRLSRKVYAVLYAQMLFDLALGTLQPAVSLQSHLESFQTYLLCGCLSLATIQLLRGVYQQRLDSAERAAHETRAG